METEHHEIDSPESKEERLQELIREIESLTYECENDTEHDTLAMILLLKAIQSFGSRYNEEISQYAIDCMVGEFKKKKATIAAMISEQEKVVHAWFDLNRNTKD